MELLLNYSDEEDDNLFDVALMAAEGQHPGFNWSNDSDVNNDTQRVRRQKSTGISNLPIISFNDSTSVSSQSMTRGNVRDASECHVGYSNTSIINCVASRCSYIEGIFLENWDFTLKYEL